MFYAHIVLAKKGPLARIWLAAHWDKKLTKAHVFETNIEQSVDGIMQPKVKLALRTSGHLLLGVVRIYSRKAKYLLADCNEAFVKIKMAFRPGMVDLPEEHREAAVNAITLPEVFHDFDTALPELNDVDIEAQFSINQSRADEITMREDYGSLPLAINDEGFGDLGFDNVGNDFIRDGVDPNIDESLMGEDFDQVDEHTLKEAMPGTSRAMSDMDAQNIMNDDGFGGGGFGQEPAAGLFEGDIFGDTSIAPQMPQLRNDSDDDMDGGGWEGAPHSPGSSSNGSRPTSPALDGLPQATDASKALPPALDDSLTHIDEPHLGDRSADALVAGDGSQADGVALESGPADDGELETNNEEESFALAPIDAAALKGVTKTKRKRKLIVDEVKNISGEEMKSQLANTSDIITTLDLAPPTKRLMYWKETGGVEKLFALPSRDIPARNLSKNYQRHLVSRSTGIEDFSVLGPADALALDQYQDQPVQPIQSQDVVTGKRGRKRKLPLVPEPPAPDLTAHSVVMDASSRTEKAIDVSVAAGPAASSMIQEGDIPQPFGSSSILNENMPQSLLEGSLTPAVLHDDYSAFPALDHNMMMTPNRIDQIESIPNLPVDTVSSILNGPGMDNYANLGYDDGNNLDGGSPGMSERIANDWNDDYDFPPSVEPPNQNDEQMENETDEQFEERVLNKRAAQMFVSVRARIQKQDTLMLSDMTYRNNRKQAAQKFYSLLVLKKFQALEISQESAYGDVKITKGIMFDNPKL